MQRKTTTYGISSMEQVERIPLTQDRLSEIGSFIRYKRTSRNLRQIDFKTPNNHLTQFKMYLIENGMKKRVIKGKQVFKKDNDYISILQLVQILEKLGLECEMVITPKKSVC